MSDRPQGARIGSMDSVYYDMCEAAFVTHQRIGDKHSILSADPNETAEEAGLRHQAFTSSISCIVFAGMCLEAAVYDYAAWHLPPHLVNTLDKLDLVGKWMIIPQLVTKKAMQVGAPAHNALIALTRNRNELVHSKSQWAKSGDEGVEQTRFAIDGFGRLHKGCIDAIRAIILVSLECSRHHENTINPLPLFKSPGDTRFPLESREYPDEVKALISECRRSFKKTA